MTPFKPILYTDVQLGQFKCMVKVQLNILKTPGCFKISKKMSTFFAFVWCVGVRQLTMRKMYVANLNFPKLFSSGMQSALRWSFSACTRVEACRLLITSECELSCQVYPYPARGLIASRRGGYSQSWAPSRI